MSKLSNKAFAIMAVCEKTKEHFGITVDPRNGCYAFTWAFKIKKCPVPIICLGSGM